MAQFVLTNQAKNDLITIGRYTAEKWGREQRNVYLAHIDEAFHMLATGVSRGKNCDEVRLGYRKQKVGSHIIFYRPAENQFIEIVRILHERMDPERHIQSDDS